MDPSAGWVSTAPAYHPPGQLHDAYHHAPAQYHDAYLNAPPAQHHDLYRHVSAVQQYDSYQNEAAHYQPSSQYHGAQQQPSYDQSYYHNPPPSRYASSQSHYPIVGTEVETHLLRGAYEGVPGATAADAGGYFSYAVSVAGAPRLSVKDAIRQFGADPNAYGGSALHSQPNSSMVVTPPPPYHMGRASTNLLGPRRLKNTMKKKAKGQNTVKSQSAYCQVCKVECNTEEVLKSHKAGKKHKKNLESLKESISMTPSKPPGGTAPKPKKMGPVTAKPATEGGTAKSKKKKTESENEDLETKKLKVLEAGAPAEGVKICTLCNVVCNSPVVFDSHLEGHKHKAMAQKLQEGQQVGK